MKKYLVIAFLFAFVSGASAQSFLKDLGKKVVEKAKDKTEEKVLRGVDKAFDKTEDAVDGAVSNSGKKKRNKSKDSYEEADYSSGNDYSDDGYEVSQPATAAPQQQAAVQVAQSPEMAYAKSDFVPGDEIFFEDNVDNEQLGEFPSQWDLDRGSAEVAMIGGKKAIYFVDPYTTITPLMKNSKEYLPEVFTIEYDLYLGYKSKEEYSAIDMVLLADGSTCFKGTFGYNGNDIYTAYRPDGSSISGNYKYKNLIKEGEWNHLSLSFNRRACKVYINGTRVINIPNMKAPTCVSFQRQVWDDHKYVYLTNFRFAKGAVPLYDRMMSDGKFITYGITFDVGKSTIKPESMSEINRILQLMNENPELKFSVEGHTDSTGSKANNQKLSDARSQAIVDKLVELGIAADRLTAVGKGQDSPIADNSTDEGRAKNRRVEFVKM